MKYLIVGLGNIGVRYENTRHNIGFKVLDAMAMASDIVFKPARYADIAEYKFKARNFVLVKPTTYMNLSGKAVNYWLKKEKLNIDRMLIIVDDVSLPFGTIRIRQKGSDAGHNGLADIHNTLGHSNYYRLRFGIGDDYAKGGQVNYVLGEWSAEQKKQLPERIDKMIEAIKSFGTVGIERTMNFYNGR